MRILAIKPQPRLASLLIRLSLTQVFCAWAYDIAFNPAYYSHLLGSLHWPVFALLVGLSASFVVGVGTRTTGLIAAGLLVYLGIAQEGHQPIGLPQNAGLAAGAMALTLLGPGVRALVRGTSRVSAREVLVAGWLIRLGLSLTFLVYAIYKFANGDEYRIVVAEAPMISYVAQILGAQTTVSVVGFVEVVLALIMLPGFSSVWAAALQSLALGSFLFALGYPFSYPQDVGLIGVAAAFVCTQTIALPVALRRSSSRGRFGLLGRVALDQRGFASAAPLIGGLVVVRALAGADLQRLVDQVRDAVRPTDLVAPYGADGYCVLFQGVDSAEALDVAMQRVRQSVSADIGVGASLWSPELPLQKAMQRAADSARRQMRATVASETIVIRKAA